VTGEGEYSAPCAYCKGEGRIGSVPCPACGGRKAVRTDGTPRKCIPCDGFGIAGCCRCSGCGGTGWSNCIPDK
jgi:hypothetical protein